MLQANGGVLHVHGPVLGFLRMLQNADDDLADGGQGCSAENTIASVVQVDALFFQVDKEADRDAPVQERSRGDDGVGQAAAGGSFFLQRILHYNFVLEQRESPGFLHKRVGTELGRNETLDTGFGRGF